MSYLESNQSLAVTESNISQVEESTSRQLALSEEEMTKLSTEVNFMVDEVFAIDLSSAENRIKIVDKLDSLGEDVIKRSTNACSLLKISVKDLSKLGDKDDSQSVVIKTMADLNEELRRLDPSKINFDEKGLFGRVARSIRRYFAQYETADKVIQNIIKTLDSSRRRLENDNKTLEIKQVDLRNTTKELAKIVQYVIFLNDCLSERIELERANPDKEELIKFIESNISFVILQKIEDLEKQMLVNQQGYIAIEIIRRNNSELMRNVRRASTTTVSALETAVIVASALYNQKIVLKQVNVTNQLTDNMIKSTSEILRTQGVEIQRQSVNSGPSIETLEEAFNIAFSAFDEFERFRLDALPLMKERVQKFAQLSQIGEAEIKKIEATKTV